MAAKKLFILVVIVLSGIALLRYSHAGNDSTLPRQGTVPTTQSTVNMNRSSGSGERSERLLAPTLDMSNPVHRQKLLANFDREREILKKRGLSEDEVMDLKDAIINGDTEKIKRVYRMENGGK